MIRPSGPDVAAAHTEARAAGEVRIREIRTRDAAVELRILRAAWQVEQFLHISPSSTLGVVGSSLPLRRIRVLLSVWHS